MRKIIFISIFALGMFFALTSRAQAANHYIRDGGTGSGDCGATTNSWANACDDLPTTFVRGDTYYIADGSYGAHTFNTPELNEQYIYIKKATASNHGTDTGWNNSFGAGQAIFSMAAPSNVWADFMLVITSSFWDFDGGYGELNGTHGMKFMMTGTGSGGVKLVVASGQGKGINNLNFSHIDFASRGVTYAAEDAGFYMDSNSPYVQGNYTFSNCYFHDSAGVLMHLLGSGFDRYPADKSIPTSNITEHMYNLNIDHCYFARISTLKGHAEAIQGGANGFVVSNSVFEDIEGTAVLSMGYTKNAEIYGNVFFQTPNYPYPGQLGSGVSFIAGCTEFQSCDNFSFYNNTVSLPIGVHAGVAHGAEGYSEDNPVVGMHFGAPPTRFVVYNNLFYNTPDVMMNGTTHDYNYFINSQWSWNTSPNEHETRISSADIFVNPTLYNFRLKSSLPGLDMVNIDQYVYNRTDALGNTRGADGTWDRGAYEYTTACTTPGDFTCNGFNISDIQTMISIILGTDTTTNRTQADMNTDTLVNISDLQLLINKVLGIN